jgi:hypothetical protein
MPSPANRGAVLRAEAPDDEPRQLHMLPMTEAAGRARRLGEEVVEDLLVHALHDTGR